VQGPISRTGALDPRIARVAWPVLWAAFLTLLVAGPWLKTGYIFGTDWPGPRQFKFPTGASSTAGLEAALAAVSLIFSGEVAGKAFLVGLLFVAAYTAYWAVPASGFLPGASASIVYLVNPFVYGRLHYGQFFVLAGYAVLPWVAARVRRLLLEPAVRQGLVAAVSLTLIGVLSPHLFLLAFVVAGTLLVTHIVAQSSRFAYMRHLAPFFLLTVAVTLAASAYWIIPLLGGSGSVGTLLSGIKSGDLAAFAAVPDQHLGLVPNLLGLYGFWAENSGRFASMKGFVPLWPAVLAVLLMVGAVGAIAAYKQRKENLAPWVAGLLVSALLALGLEMGVSHPWTAGLVTWLDAHFSVYRGMRDSGKWAAVLALTYSQLIGLGSSTILDWLHKHLRDPIQLDWLRKGLPDATRWEWVGGAAAGLLLALPLYYGNGLLFGAHGEIKPSQYPAGWYSADRVLAADPHPERTLFLPWHEYISYSFVRNENNVVAPVAPTFFSVPTLVSSNPEVPGVVPPPGADQDAISSLVRAGGGGQWASVLAEYHIKYVLLAHELNWSSFSYLDDQPDMVKIGDYGSIVLYRNNLVA
jgi:hypothetical protein